MKYKKILCVNENPDVEDYYLTDQGELYYYFPDDDKDGWCTSEARPNSEEYPTYWMKPIGAVTDGQVEQARELMDQSPVSVSSPKPSLIQKIVWTITKK